MLDVRRLQVLREVARHGSFRAAADALAYTPSAVSQQIAALEREAGRLVVERGARGVALTEPGRILVTAAEDVRARLTAAERELDALAGLEAGLLRLGWFATAGATLMPRAIAGFSRRHPKVRLDLFQGDPHECLPRLRARELELALVYQFEFEEPIGTDLDRVPLIHDPLYLGVPADHPLADAEVVEIGQLADEPWIQGVRAGATLDVLPSACGLAGFTPRVVFRTDDRIAVEGLVAAGVGVALFPRMTLPAVRHDVIVRPLVAAGLSRQVFVALPRSRYRSPAGEAMVGILHEVCTELVAEATERVDKA